MYDSAVGKMILSALFGAFRLHQIDILEYFATPVQHILKLV